MCFSATATFFGLCPIFVQMFGYCPPHDAISSIKTFSKISSVSTRLDGIRLFGLHQLAGNIEQRFYAATYRYPRRWRSICRALATRGGMAHRKPLRRRRDFLRGDWRSFVSARANTVTASAARRWRRSRIRSSPARNPIPWQSGRTGRRQNPRSPRQLGQPRIHIRLAKNALHVGRSSTALFDHLFGASRPPAATRPPHHRDAV